MWKRKGEEEEGEKKKKKKEEKGRRYPHNGSVWNGDAGKAEVHQLFGLKRSQTVIGLHSFLSL